uniref:ABC transporter permease subunit n=1 Tax=Rubidibacter lacunae TaxID=582514 RepID=UPI0012EC14F6
MDFLRIRAIALNGFREAIRDRVLYFIAFYALLLALATATLRYLSGGAHEKILLDFGVGAMALLSAAIAIYVGTGLINKEIERQTVLMLLPKPLSRAEFAIGKHVGLTAVLAVAVAAMTVLYFAFLGLSGTSFPLGPLLLSSLFLLLELAIVVAIALVFGAFTTSLIAMLLSFGVYVMGHFSSDIVEFGKIANTREAIFFTRLLYLILPDLERFNLRNDAVYGILPPVPELCQSVLYGGFYIVIVLAIATFAFSRRQF